MKRTQKLQAFIVSWVIATILAARDARPVAAGHTLTDVEATGLTRGYLGSAAWLQRHGVVDPPAQEVGRITATPKPARPFRRAAWTNVGWTFGEACNHFTPATCDLRPVYRRQLDTLASLPNGVNLVRVNEIFTRVPGSVWPSSAPAPDFAPVLDLLQQIVDSGMHPYVSLSGPDAPT